MLDDVGTGVVADCERVPRAEVDKAIGRIRSKYAQGGGARLFIPGGEYRDVSKAKKQAVFQIRKSIDDAHGGGDGGVSGDGGGGASHVSEMTTLNHNISAISSMIASVVTYDSNDGELPPEPKGKAKQTKRKALYNKTAPGLTCQDNKKEKK